MSLSQFIRSEYYKFILIKKNKLIKIKINKKKILI